MYESTKCPTLRTLLTLPPPPERIGIAESTKTFQLLTLMALVFNPWPFLHPLPTPNLTNQVLGLESARPAREAELCPFLAVFLHLAEPQFPHVLHANNQASPRRKGTVRPSQGRWVEYINESTSAETPPGTVHTCSWSIPAIRVTPVLSIVRAWQ